MKGLVPGLRWSEGGCGMPPATRGRGPGGWKSQPRNTQALRSQPGNLYPLPEPGPGPASVTWDSRPHCGARHIPGLLPTHTPAPSPSIGTPTPRGTETGRAPWGSGLTPPDTWPCSPAPLCTWCFLCKTGRTVPALLVKVRVREGSAVKSTL